MNNLQEIWEALLDGKTLNNKSNKLTVKLEGRGDPKDQNGKTAYFFAPEQWEIAHATPEKNKLYAYSNNGGVGFYEVLLPESSITTVRRPEYDIEYPEDK